jgi:predicted ABC-type ATPase
MADIAPKLIHLSGEKLLALHERIHKSEASPASIEVHHTILNEMARRKMERPQDDWDTYEILVDSIQDVELDSLRETLPPDMVSKMLEKTGSPVANLQTYLTIHGYEMRVEPVVLEPVEKMIRRENGKWVVYNEAGTRRFGSYDSESEAQERLKQIEAFSKADYTPPKGVREAARRAVDWINEGKAGGGFTSVGRRRASQLASGESVSIETLKRMKSFFSRHEVDKEALGFTQGEKGFPSPGRVAWDAWGGDAGFSWAKEKVAQFENQMEKHNQGQHDQKTHGKWADGIVQDIFDGKHPEVEPENVSALFMKMADRTDHPDITEIKIEGTLLFGDEGMGIARKDMPQIDKDLRPEFLDDLEKDGITSEKEKVDPKTLKPVQKEVSGSRAGAIYNKYREEGKIPKQDRILISKDGFVIDGHHTWAASVAFSFDNPSAKIPVYRLSVNAQEALDASLAWTESKGIEGQSIDAAKKSLFFEFEPGEMLKHQDHDQSSHGNWAEGRERIIGSGNVPSLARDSEGRVINPDATGGYKAGVPESVTFGRETLTPEHSLWHHLVPDGRGGYEPSEERAYLHQQIINQVTEGVPQSSDPTFYMLGGGPASGKSTFLKSGATDTPDKANAVHVNADDIKAMLPENPRMVNGGDADFFNAASFSHEESSMLAKRVQDRAIENKQNIVLDGTGDSAINKLASKVESARQNGYKVNGVYVSVPTEVAWSRSVQRALGASKRYVPKAVVEETHRAVSGTLRQAVEGGLFNKISLWDNTGSAPKLVGSGSGNDFMISDSDAWQAFLAKENE